MHEAQSFPALVSLLKKEGITIQRLSYTLLKGYDASQAMLFQKGEVTDPETLKTLQTELLQLRKSAVAYTATAIGELAVTASNGTTFRLHPVFHTDSDSYRDFVYVGTDLCILTPTLCQLLDTLRQSPEGMSRLRGV